MLRSPALDAWAGATLFVKAEHHQHAGAFKYRGASNAVWSLSSADASRGVAAHSSGNHAAALARAAHERGIAAYVVMPENTTAFKSGAVARYGAEIVWCAGTLASRRAVLAEVLARTGASEIHPFYDVDKLQRGDDIIIETVAGTFTYKMTAQLVVDPTDVQVVANTPDAELTLTSCNPKFSAEQRIVIKARLAPNESAKPTRAQAPGGTTSGGKVRPHQALMEEGLSGQQRSLTPAVRWGLAALLVGLAWWWAFRRWRHPLTWVAGVIPFLAVLFAFYVYFEQALPAGY